MRRRVSNNQLIRENNARIGKTYVWTYDNAGNITSRKEYACTLGELGTPIATYNYTYNDFHWGDLLTAYNGVARTYDTIGNLLTDGTWTYTWRNDKCFDTLTRQVMTCRVSYISKGLPLLYATSRHG